MLELRNISKAYASGRRVIERLSHIIPSGQYVAIMGDSGVGKSTLLNLVAGLDKPDEGKILIGGKDIGAMDDDAATELRRKQFGFVFQAFHVLPHLTLAQNVAMPLLLNAAGHGEAMQRAQATLDALGLSGRGRDFPRQLSGGELQRVAIARALVHKPSLLLADEPTGNLDPDTAHVVLTMLRKEIKANGATGIIVTHSPAAAATADQILILSREGLRPA
jgi:putative ABC transport system ATP-binding protein